MQARAQLKDHMFWRIYFSLELELIGKEDHFVNFGLQQIFGTDQDTITSDCQIEIDLFGVREYFCDEILFFV